MKLVTFMVRYVSIVSHEMSYLYDKAMTRYENYQDSKIIEMRSSLVSMRNLLRVGLALAFLIRNCSFIILSSFR